MFKIFFDPVQFGKKLPFRLFSVKKIYIETTDVQSTHLFHFSVNMVASLKKKTKKKQVHQIKSEVCQSVEST